MPVLEVDCFTVTKTAEPPGNTVLVAVGQTRAFEFIADNTGAWAMHCHMTHHTMNQMGHNSSNLIGVHTGGVDKRVSKYLQGYMTMGESGMADMGEIGMPVPRHNIPMVGATAKHDCNAMRGMLPIL